MSGRPGTNIDGRPQSAPCAGAVFLVIGPPASATTIMKLSDEYDDFEGKLDRVHPRWDEALWLPLLDKRSGLNERGRQLRRPYCNFGGCSSPLIQACISDNRIGSPPSHWTHWNLRPPVSKTMKCIGLRHFGQEGGVGGGRFSAMTLTLDSGASHTELTVAGDAEERDGDGRRLEPVPF